MDVSLGSVFFPFSEKVTSTVDTSLHNFPLHVIVFPLTRDYYYPLLSKTEIPNQNMNFSQEICFNFSDIMGIRQSRNCSEHCIPITFSSLFNTSEIPICKDFIDHFCAYNDIWFYVLHQQKICMKPDVEKYFKGSIF